MPWNAPLTSEPGGFFPLVARERSGRPAARIGGFEMAREPNDPVGAALPRPPTPHIFKDRTAAGEQLAERLQSLLARPCVIAAIPRGRDRGGSANRRAPPEASRDCPRVQVDGAGRTRAGVRRAGRGRSGYRRSPDRRPTHAGL